MVNLMFRLAVVGLLALPASQADARTFKVSRTCAGSGGTIGTTGAETFEPTEVTYRCKGRGGRSTLHSRSDTTLVAADGSCPAGQLQLELDPTFPNGSVESFENGSQIFSTDDVLVGCVDLTTTPVSVTFSGTGTITGGTGKYRGAQGSIEYSGTTLVTTGENGVQPQSIEVTGTLTVP